MTDTAMQTNECVDTAHGCGTRLRRAREAAGLSRDDVAARLKMPVRVVQSLEEEDWSRLGAPVFVRGQLRSYSRLLGLGTSATIAAAHVAPVEPPALVTHAYVPRHRYLFEQFSRRAAYIAITLAIAGSVWMGTRGDLGQPATIAPLDVPGPVLGEAPRDARPARTPLAASMTPPSPATPADAPTLDMRFEDASWLEVRAADGTVVEEVLVQPGGTRSFPLDGLGSVVLGNAAAVTLEKGGRPVDLAPFLRANVARFTVSSSGALAPAGD
jgi:cytoskeleton protein RodZ